jgi:hypothetical protein
MPGPTSDLARETVSPDEQSISTEFIAFLKAASAARHPAGDMRRFNQARASGCAEAEFIVATGLPAELKVGLFQQPRSYSAWIRFANATSTSDREKDVRGMSIKVRGVRGENLTRGSDMQDFVLNSHPVMMVRGPRVRVATESIQSSRHPVLEYHAVSVRSRSRREIHRAAGRTCPPTAAVADR